VGNLAHAVGWRYCINAPAPQVPLLRLFRMSLAGWAINYLTPSASLGGEVTKAALLAATHKGPEAVSSVLLDKLTSAIGHLLLAILGSLFLLWRLSLPAKLWIAMAVTSGLLAGGMFVFLLLQKHGELGSLLRWLVKHRLGGRPLERAARHISEVDDALKRFYRERPLGLVLAVGWHLLGHSAAIFQAGLFLRLLEQPAPFATFAAVGFLSLWFDLLTFAIPLNLGTLEGSRIVALEAVGGDALLGMTFGVAIRVAQVFWACFGLASYSLFAVHEPGSVAAKSASSACASSEAR
jgi:uncharacterized protein (TIRG00374 family)